MSTRDFSKTCFCVIIILKEQRDLKSDLWPVLLVWQVLCRGDWRESQHLSFDAARKRRTCTCSNREASVSITSDHSNWHLDFYDGLFLCTATILFYFFNILHSLTVWLRLMLWQLLTSKRMTVWEKRSVSALTTLTAHPFILTGRSERRKRGSRRGWKERNSSRSTSEYFIFWDKRAWCTMKTYCNFQKSKPLCYTISKYLLFCLFLNIFFQDCWVWWFRFIYWAKKEPEEEEKEKQRQRKVNWRMKEEFGMLNVSLKRIIMNQFSLLALRAPQLPLGERRKRTRGRKRKGFI